MATTITGIGTVKVLSNLDTYNHTTTLASMYNVQVDLSEQPPTGCSITIQQNGSTKATSATPGATQLNMKLGVLLNCAIGDVISVILASSNTAESAPNQIKAILKITPGTI
jgi:hypothetical protein